MDRFFSEVQKKPKALSTGLPSDSAEKDEKAANSNQALPKGVVLGKDGKPCRSCTSSAAWTAMMKQKTSRPFPSSPSSTTTTNSSDITTSAVSSPSLASSFSSESNASSSLPADCPPDVERLGSSTWTFLHTLSSAYPAAAAPPQQSEMKQFLTLFSKLYPCWHCAEDFQTWMAREENKLVVNDDNNKINNVDTVNGGQQRWLSGRRGLMRWMCEAHNEVNVKLGKKTFDCGARSLEERWGSGPGDGRCG